MNWVKIILFIVLFGICTLLFSGGLYFGVDMISEEVVVVNQTLAAYEEIQLDHLETKRYLNVLPSMFRPEEKDAIVGKITRTKLAAGEPVLDFRITTPDESFRGDRGIIAIPTHWLTSYPYSIRPHDRVVIYRITEGEEQPEKFLEDIPVYRVKDSSGNDIGSKKEGRSDDPRARNEGAIAEIELWGTPQEKQKILDAAKDGKLSIMYYTEEPEGDIFE